MMVEGFLTHALRRVGRSLNSHNVDGERRDRSFPGPALDGSEMDGEGARRTFLWEFPIRLV